MVYIIVYNYCGVIVTPQSNKRHTLNFLYTDRIFGGSARHCELMGGLREVDHIMLNLPYPYAIINAKNAVIWCKNGKFTCRFSKVFRTIW